MNDFIEVGLAIDGDGDEKRQISAAWKRSTTRKQLNRRS